jgi:anaerobic magnesium-protoporphyrin IX monomethyl ester cyclase
MLGGAAGQQMPAYAKDSVKFVRSPVRGLDSSRAVDSIFVNTPLRDYDKKPRLNNFTLPVLGLGYIATVAADHGLNVGVLDGEALGLSFTEIAAEINRRNPRWAGFNLLAPTYVHTVEILKLLNPQIRIMLGGHQAKALPEYIVEDRRIPRVDALILGEAEYRVAALISGSEAIEKLPQVLWRTSTGIGAGPKNHSNANFLSPDINAMPFVDREYFADDPYYDSGMLESAIVGSRGCPFDCSFCGVAISANRDVSIRSRSPASIVGELSALKVNYKIAAARFVDDLFLADLKTMSECASAFVSENLELAWDATGRINVLAKVSSSTLSLLKRSGCREIALGIESGSDRMLEYIDKKITTEQAVRAVIRLCEIGINVKGYFILGFPTEKREEHYLTLALIGRLWKLTESLPGRFRCSVFEYRPYPGTPDWRRLEMRGYDVSRLLTYEEVDITNGGSTPLLLDRDEFNFTTNLQLSDVPLVELRQNLIAIMSRQKERNESSISGAVSQAKSSDRRTASSV